jgi:hypothetical protein
MSHLMGSFLFIVWVSEPNQLPLTPEEFAISGIVIINTRAGWLFWVRPEGTVISARMRIQTCKDGRSATKSMSYGRLPGG